MAARYLRPWGEVREVREKGQTVCASWEAGLMLLRAEEALPCPRGAEAVNGEAIVRLGGAERGKGAGI